MKLEYNCKAKYSIERFISHRKLSASNGVLLVPLLPERSEVTKSRTPLDGASRLSNGVLNVIAARSARR